MQKAFQIMSAVAKVEGFEFKKLGWGSCFQGTSKQFKELREMVRGAGQNLEQFPYRSRVGYEDFAERFTRSSMLKAHLLMRAICRAQGVRFLDLKWGGRFLGTAEESRSARKSA